MDDTETPPVADAIVKAKKSDNGLEFALLIFTCIFVGFGTESVALLFATITGLILIDGFITEAAKKIIAAIKESK